MAKGKKRRPKKSGGSYLSPGVYVEEVSSGSRPIEAVGTAVAAFVGFARRQPVGALAVVLTVLAAAAGAVRAVRS